MEFSHWLVFASIITLASISPGPNVLAVIINAVAGGVRGAAFTILGNLLALFTIALVAAIGVGALLQAAPSVFSFMKLCGGLYLAWMGFKMLKSSFTPMSAIDASKNAEVSTVVGPMALMTQAMLISYSNPKSILFLSAVFPTFLTGSGSTLLQFTIMFATIIGIVCVIHGSYALLALRLKGHLVTPRTRQRMARVAGLTFLGFGAGFVVDSQK